MNELMESFEKAVDDLYTIDWSESDGSDVRKVLKNYFDDIPNNKLQIRSLIENCSKFNKFQKILTVKVLEAC